MNNIITCIKRKLWINKYCQNILYVKEAELLTQERFLAIANEQLEKFRSKVQMEELALAEMEESHKYEDRQKKNRQEKILEALKENTEKQVKEIDMGNKAKYSLMNDIQQIEQNVRYLKDNF